MTSIRRPWWTVHGTPFSGCFADLAEFPILPYLSSCLKFFESWIACCFPCSSARCRRRPWCPDRPQHSGAARLARLARPSRARRHDSLVAASSVGPATAQPGQCPSAARACALGVARVCAPARSARPTQPRLGF
jgi:hypothetical protein